MPDLDRRRILVVDDEERMVRFIRMNLEHDGFQVGEAFNGKQAIQKIRDFTPDLILLDVMMPDIDGFDVLETVRDFSNVPVIMLTAKGEEDDRVRGLEHGADDYITKPFSIEELLLKIDIFLRRTKYANILRGNKPVSIGQYTFDYKNLSLAFGDLAETLTQKEADLLKLLNENRNQVVKRSFILETIWGKDDYFLGRSLDVFISRLRKYLSQDEHIKIENIHGVGFKFRVDD